jgi:hypothetical protein
MKRLNKVKISVIGVLVVAFLIMINLGVSQAADPDSWKTKSISAKVVKIDKDAREITLVDGKKNEVVFAVDTKVKNFDKIAEGDKVVAKCYLAFATEVRRPNAEEKQTPFVELDTKYDSPPNTSPASGQLKMFKAVVKVVGEDRFLKMVQVKDSRNKIFTVDASKSIYFNDTDNKGDEKLKVGDTIIVTYVQPLITSIKKK